MTDQSTVSSRLFGTLPSGEAVTAYTLAGAGGLQLECITYGGTVTKLLAADRNGDVADVVLGFDSLDGYLSNHPFFGAITGRVAGRTTNGTFTLDSETYTLEINDPPNNLHGGSKAFDKQLWNAEVLNREDGSPSVRFTRTSADGEAGFPGNLQCSVTYTVTPDNAFIIDTEFTTDKATPVSLTHHAYFNLAGEASGSIDGHELQIRANDFCPTDDAFTLLGRREPVAGTANDLNTPRVLGEVIPDFQGKHGVLYFLRDKPQQIGDTSAERLIEVARVTEPASGRVMTVHTTEDCLQLYSSVFLVCDHPGKTGTQYQPFGGLCLECEGYPDGANRPELGDIILRPGQTMKHTTVYALSVE